MMTAKAMTLSACDDAGLVAESLSGNSDAFGQIVARYQSLVCSLAYSATGSLSHSEDLAQETFVTAWQQLRQLREPGKLRSWLCGIARNLIHNWLRRQGREPSHAAESLDGIDESPAREPLPHDEVIGREEQAILWRSLEKIPEIYREPLVLFYREHQSIEAVAQNLELSEDAVKQRLSRGRKLLHEEVLAFVESALQRTSPGTTFTLAVLASLPVLTGSAKAATLGAAAAQGSAAAKSAAGMGLLYAILGPLLGIFGAWIGYRMSLDSARTEREREFVKFFGRWLCLLIVVFSVLLGTVVLWGAKSARPASGIFIGAVIAICVAYPAMMLAMFFWAKKKQREFLSGHVTARLAGNQPIREYRSKTVWLGWPLVHVRLDESVMDQDPVKAWIAVGNRAYGLLFAFGGIAIAPVSVGAIAVGLMPWGGCALGLFACGGFAAGVWAFGGLALGWLAFGGCAVAWKAALGGVALAHEFALGGLAQASEVNSPAATGFIKTNWFFYRMEFAVRHIIWLNLLWLGPLIAWWRTAARKGAK